MPGVVALVGIVGAVVWGLASYAALGDRVDGFTRDAPPGQVTVPIDTAGTYAVCSTRRRKRTVCRRSMWV